MLDCIPAWSVLVVLIYLALVTLGFWLLYTVIRLAVRKGLRQHQEWLETRDRPVSHVHQDSGHRLRTMSGLESARTPIASFLGAPCAPCGSGRTVEHAHGALRCAPTTVSALHAGE